MPTQLAMSRAAMDTLIARYAEQAQQQLDILITLAQRDQHAGVYRDADLVVTLSQGLITITTAQEWNHMMSSS